MSRIKIAVLGITGKMGQLLAELISSAPDLDLIGGTTSGSHPLKDHPSYGIPISSKLSEVCEPADILIDFSAVSAVPHHIEQAIYYKKPLLIGVTGLQPDHYQLLQEAAKAIPVLHANNTSLGIALLTKLVHYAAQVLDSSYDIEIVETHHRNKIDAPSGTALQLGQATAQARKTTLEAVQSFFPQGKRAEGTIGFACSRGGQVVGEHTVRFLGDEEIIELTHKGLDRRLYARGALKAARWLVHQPAGLYGIQDTFSHVV